MVLVGVEMRCSAAGCFPTFTGAYPYMSPTEHASYDCFGFLCVTVGSFPYNMKGFDVTVVIWC